MSAREEAGPLPSLLRVTIRRSAVSGRIYLVVGAGLASFYSVVFAVIGGATFVSTFPLLLPVVSVVGCLGSMMIFTTDRVKGVFEYLISYGITPRTLFFNVLIAGLVLESVVLAVTTGVGVGVFVLLGNRVPLSLVISLGAYALPMTYASAALCVTLGMIWTSLSTPREGMNSPLGLLPIVGIAPPLGTLVLAGVVGLLAPRAIYLAIYAPIVTIGVAVVLVLNSLDRFLRRERLLSPA